MQPNCYIDTDGRVACDAGDDRMQNPATATLRLPPGRAQTTLVARTKPAAQSCCVHVLAKSFTRVTERTPVRGRIDCPERPEIHEKPVMITALVSDGKGGLLASYRVGIGPATSATPRGRLPVCTVGPQDGEVVPCCLVAGPGGDMMIRCDDPKHVLHGKPATVAIARGVTLELCPPPVAIPPCCVELGSFGGKNARIVCEDETNASHHKPISVTVSPDGTSASIKIGDRQVEVPICETTDIPFEIPCCIKDGLLVCPGTPYHGITYEDAVRRYGVRLLPCKETPPGKTPPPDCCVKREGSRVFLVCSDASSPYNGLELQPHQYQCHGDKCTVVLVVGNAATRPQTFVFPICEGGREPVPPDCCYDVATGQLVCTDKSSEWHGLKVSLIDLTDQLVVVFHEKLGRMRFPICKVGVPDDCCFEPSAKPRAGVTGKLICTSAGALNGRDATLLNLRTAPDGSLIGVVSFVGGTATMRLCKRPPVECPECPPPYFCCVNLDTGRFVCPANAARNGQPANVREVMSKDGAPWAILADGQWVPACGSGCPSPEPCKPPGLVPDPPGDCPPPGIVPTDPPDMRGEGPKTPPGCDPDTGIPMTRPDMPGTGPATPPGCTPSTNVPMTGPDMPGTGPATPPGCTPATNVPMTRPDMPGTGPATPPGCTPSSTIPMTRPDMPGTGPATPPGCAPATGVPMSTPQRGPLGIIPATPRCP